MNYENYSHELQAILAYNGSKICLNTTNKPSDFQYARFQVLPVHLYFGLVWSDGKIFHPSQQESNGLVFK